VNPQDPAHEKADLFVQGFKGQIVTTELVLMELADGWSRPSSRRAAFLSLLADMRASPDTEIIPATHQLVQEGIDLYEQRPDKEWTLTDCISFVVMEREGITEALTGDHHFEQAGFVALLK
jgi:predicted nucleic acid-binding protein